MSQRRAFTVTISLAILALAAFSYSVFSSNDGLLNVRANEKRAPSELHFPDAWLCDIGVIPYDYPLGDFARVSHWSKVFRNLNGVSVSKADYGGYGDYYEVAYGAGGASGMMRLDEVDAARIGPSGQWVLEIPLASGGSAGDTGAVVFEMVDGSPTLVGTISEGDSQAIAIHGNRIVASTPQREQDACMACNTQVNVSDYILTAHGLSRVRHRLLPVDDDPTLVAKSFTLTVMPTAADVQKSGIIKVKGGGLLPTSYPADY